MRGRLTTRKDSAFTLIEMLVSMVIMATLAGILSISYGAVIKKAEMVACMGNLRRLHDSFASYVQDNNRWPQMPEDIGDRDTDFYNWIIGEVTPYGGERAAWMCPTEEKERMVQISAEDFVGSYVPTLFDSGPNTPWQWAKQPWLIERASNHKKGALLVMPDSSVHTVSEAMNLH